MNGMAAARRASSRSAAPSSCSATTCGRRSASPRCPRPRSSSPGPTTRSASARTARPTSRSSTSPSLRAMPGLRLIRPADANETAAAWRVAVDGDGPTALVLTRQDLPVLDGHRPTAPRGRGRLRAASTPTATPDLVLVGTGSEVSVCVDAAELLADRGHRRAGRVDAVAGTCSSAQTTTYQDAVLPPERARRSRSRPASSFGWDRWADDSVGIDRFGASAPGRRSRSLGREACGCQPPRRRRRAGRDQLLPTAEPSTD